MESSRTVGKLATRGLRVSLFLLALSAPVSIAATQTAWALALLFWIIRSVAAPRRATPARFDLALLAFVGLSLASSIFSYEPEVSLRKMVAVSLVTIVYLFAGNICAPGMVKRAVSILLAAGFASCIYAFTVQAIGDDLKVVRLSADSPLRNAGVADGYTILSANGRDIDSPADLAEAIAAHSIDGSASITVYRHELIDTYSLPITAVAPGVEGLGIIEWSRGRDMRAAGFYGHYTTFAEALQLIASLAVGILILLPGGLFTRSRIILGIALFAYVAALFLTLTRASWLAFTLSAGLIFLMGTSRRTILIGAAAAVPLIVAGVFFLQQKRQVGFIDMADGSTQWRLTVWREGLGLLASEPRHLLVGVGMDSIKTHYRDWQLFDNGKLPVGHMHSTPLQIALERGVPALIAWIAWMAIYLGMLWRTLRRKDVSPLMRGILLGAFGGACGFLTSGLVHYNWGDSEVVMIFYLIMGSSLAIMRFANEGSSDGAEKLIAR